MILRFFFALLAAGIVTAVRDPGWITLLIVFFLIGVLFFFARGRKRHSVRYIPAGPLLTSAEQRFFDVLCSACPHGLLVFPKVRLGDLVRTDRNSGKEAIIAYNRVAAKHVDFVLVGADDYTPRLIVELDDSSHSRRERQRRDHFVNSVLQECSIPVLRHPCLTAYRSSDLRQVLDQVISDPLPGTYKVSTHH